MKIVVTSSPGAHDDGFGQLLAFSMDGAALGACSADGRIVDPRGLRASADRQLLYVNSGGDRIVALDVRGEVQFDNYHIPGLSAGDGEVGPDSRYYAGLRTTRTIAAFPSHLDGIGAPELNLGFVPFPRGFAFSDDGDLFLASGVRPNGHGESPVQQYSFTGKLKNARFAVDETLNPPDLAIGPDGKVLVLSEFRFGSIDARRTAIRAYARQSGALERIFSAPPGISIQRRRGLRFGPDNRPYCVAQDAVIAFEYHSGEYLGMVVRHPRLNGQATEFPGD